MKGQLKDQRQVNLFVPNLIQIVNPNHELVVLANEIDWKYFDEAFCGTYSDTGRPSVPTRVMVSLMLLKHMYDLEDETVLTAWVQNPYFQYFSGMDTFQWKAPCNGSDMAHFRKRIGVSGVEKIFQYTVKMHGPEVLEETLITDTTVQETNITFPTDTKLHIKIIRKCIKIADSSGIELRQRYPRKVKQLLMRARFGHHPRRRKASNSAKRQIKTIAGRLVREVDRKLNGEQHALYRELLAMFERQLKQQSKDKDKIYSFHAPHTYCIAKGKEHKAYEFGTKVSITSGSKSGVIVNAWCMEENGYDGHTVNRTLEEIRQQFGHIPKRLVGDRGYRGMKRVGETEIMTPGNGKGKQSAYEKSKLRKLFRRRASIEPVIGHLKSDHRMERSYYKGIIGDQMNVLLASSAWNLKKYMKKLREAFSLSIFSGIRRITDSFRWYYLGFIEAILNSIQPNKTYKKKFEVSF